MTYKTNDMDIITRRVMGILGMLLPILDIGFGYFWCKYVMGIDIPNSLFESVSSSYYSPGGIFFSVIVVAVSIFLILYHGYDIKDRWITTITGILGIIVILFPTASGGQDGINFLGLTPNITQWVHYVTSICFFIGLAVMEIWQFTKTGDTEPTEKKKLRNIIYRTCGIGMLVSVFITGAIMFLWHVPFVLYAGEGFGLELFGIAWLVKGKAILKD